MFFYLPIIARHTHAIQSQFDQYDNCSTVQLINLFERHILPLERAYDYLKRESVGDKTSGAIENNLLHLQLTKQRVLSRFFIDAQQPIMGDDRRLLIYDYLSIAGYDERLLQDKVLCHLSKRRQSGVLKHSIQDQFIEKLPRFSKFFPKKPKLTSYLFSSVFSLGIYYILTMLLSPLISLGLALWPLWKLLRDIAVDYFSRSKKMQIINGYIVHENVDHFIVEKLDVPIMDVGRFDISNLVENVKFYTNDIEAASKSLTTYSWTEKLFLPAQMKQQSAFVNRKLKYQINRMNEALAQIAATIPQKMASEMELLEVSFDDKKMIPYVNAHQIQRCKDFITEYGTPADTLLFQQKADPTNRWVKHIMNGSLMIPVAPDAMPWGTHRLRMDALKGWGSLLPESSPALQLCEFLQGKRTLRLHELDELISNLDLKENENECRDKIQACLFLTLNGGNAHHAALLTPAYKQLISDWYVLNKDKIDKANAMLCNVLKKIPCEIDKSLIAYLDAEDIYLYSLGQIGQESERHNQLRALFRSYTGEEDITHLIRFIPQAEQGQVLPSLASSRLRWLLTNQKSLTDNDVVLFNNQGLSGKWSFDEEALKSALWQENRDFVLKFESDCRRKLLGTEKLWKHSARSAIGLT